MLLLRLHLVTIMSKMYFDLIPKDADLAHLRFVITKYFLKEDMIPTVQAVG